MPRIDRARRDLEDACRLVRRFCAARALLLALALAVGSAAPRLRSGQGGRPQALALGPARASADRVRPRHGREDIAKASERHDQDHGLSIGAARQGVRSLRHGARRHRRHHLRQSRLSAGPFPDHRHRPDAVHVRRRAQGDGGARLLVSQICGDGDEGHAFLLRLHSRSRRAALPQEDRSAAGPARREGAPGAKHDRRTRDQARRHECPGLGSGGARGSRARRRRRHHLPLGLALSVRHRQGRQTPYRRAALHDRVHLLDEQGQIRVR